MERNGVKAKLSQYLSEQHISDMTWSMQQKAKCVEKFIELKSVTAVRRWYTRTYGNPAPSANSLRQWRREFQERGTVGHRPRSGRPQINDADVARIERAFQEQPTKSLRVASAELGIPFSTIRKVLHEKLKMFPYKISFLQQLLPEDCLIRLNYAHHIRRELRNDSGYLDRVVFSDECVFHTNGVVNKHNARVWGRENPHTVVGVPQTSEKVMVWCGMHKTKIIGPYFFSEPTVTGESYKRMLRYYAMPKVMDLPASPIFQQDGAPPHWSLAVRSYLDTKLPQRWIGRGGPIAWPPRSPDLTPLDFFLWGYVKDFVFSEEITSLSHMKERINQAIAGISTETLEKVWKNMNSRINHVVRVNGGHIEQHII